MRIALLAGVPLFALALAAPAVAEPRVVTIAGNGTAGYRDGAAADATFMLPVALAADRSGRVYVADRAAQRIRVLEAGRVRTLAGSGSAGVNPGHVAGGFADGPAASARFDEPSGVAVGPDGAVYVADRNNHAVRRIRSGNVETFAGNAGRSGTSDGPRLNASFERPAALAFDSEGDLYVADRGGIRKVDPAGQVTTLNVRAANFAGLTAFGAGASGVLYAADGRCMLVIRSGVELRRHCDRIEGDAPLGRPYGLTALDEMHVLISDPRNHVVRLFRDADPPFVTTAFQRPVAGRDSSDESAAGGYRDGATAQAEFDQPLATVVVADRVIVADAANLRLREFPLPSFRGPIGSKIADSSLGASDYRIAFASTSYGFWSSLWSDSIGGVLESRLRRDAATIGLDRTPSVSVLRMDAAPPDAAYQYVDTVSETGRYRAFVLAVNYSMPDALPGPAGDHDRQFREVLAKIDALLRARGCRMYVVVFPYGVGSFPVEDIASRLPPAAASPDAELAWTRESAFADSVRASGVATIDLIPAFRSYEAGPERRPLYAVDDVHLTVAGNAFLGERIALALERLRPWGAAGSER